jgi:hypothetical protein
MPATKQSVDRLATGHDSFLELATGELKMAIECISIYAALLEAQIAADPSLDGMRAMVREVRAQAGLVAAVVDDALSQAWEA